MQEIELKFLVSQARLKGLLRQVKIKSSQTMMLSAHYYDTPKQALAKQGIGLRIRREGDQWVQTIKAGGDGIAARLEHNATLDNAQVQMMLENDTLMPDLTLYQDTEIAPLLRTLDLKKLSKDLKRQYVTDVERITRLIKSSEKSVAASDDNSNEVSVIEVAYDYGSVIHGKDDRRSQSIHEVEFELVSGQIDFLFTIAKIWCKHHKLCLSTVTKAERGGLLINAQAHSPAVSAQYHPLDVNQDINVPAFIRAVVHNCLLQILPNSSAIVDGSEDHDHIRQLAIGTQRLRAALIAFERFSDQLNPEWLPILKQTANLLKNYHDVVCLTATNELEPQTAEASLVNWTPEIERLRIKPIDAVSANDFQLALLELIAFTMSAVAQESQAHKLAIDELAEVLTKQQGKLTKAERKLAQHKSAKSETDNSQNSATKSLQSSEELEQKLSCEIYKMLYISEFASALYATKKTKRWLKRLTKAQQAFEIYLNDQHYYQYHRQKAKTDHHASYGTGWFAAQRITSEKRYKKRLVKALKSKTFW